MLTTNTVQDAEPNSTATYAPNAAGTSSTESIRGGRKAGSHKNGGRETRINLGFGFTGSSDSANFTHHASRLPNCGSEKNWKVRICHTPYGEIQRYLCRNFDLRFSFSERSEPFEPLQNIHRQVLSRSITIPFTRQVGVSQTKAMINLAEVKTRTQEQAAGATTSISADTQGKSSKLLGTSQRKASVHQQSSTTPSTSA